MLIQIHPDNPDPRKIKQVKECLLDGGVIVYPTDTVYSLGCDILNRKALEKVARMKSIKLEKANFSIVCNDLAHLSEYSKPVENSTFKLMKALLPGPYTFILEANRNIPKIFSERKKTIGIRIPDNHIARAIVVALERPIITTSIHDDDAMLEYSTDPEVIHENLGAQVDMVIHGGYGGLLPSTILDCSKGSVEIVRQGKGSVEMLT